MRRTKTCQPIRRRRRRSYSAIDVSRWLLSVKLRRLRPPADLSVPTPPEDCAIPKAFFIRSNHRSISIKLVRLFVHFKDFEITVANLSTNELIRHMKNRNWLQRFIFKMNRSCTLITLGTTASLAMHRVSRLHKVGFGATRKSHAKLAHISSNWFWPPAPWNWLWSPILFDQ